MRYSLRLECGGVFAPARPPTRPRVGQPNDRPCYPKYPVPQVLTIDDADSTFYPKPKKGSTMTAPTREDFSDRLLRGSVKKYYEPIVDIDWDAELDPDKFYLPPQVVWLYGTPIWDAMTREQQIDLSRQELVNTLSAGIWFENILNQAILRKIMHEDPTGNETHYALTEMGDETRHMVMFGKAISRLGAKPIQPRWWQRV